MKFSDVSPLAGIATGEGLGNLTQFGALGAVADAIRRDREKDKERQQQQQTGVAPASAMKAGGKVSSASKRADGCAIRGKTRGKIV
jgi:hypothetical protein